MSTEKEKQESVESDRSAPQSGADAIASARQAGHSGSDRRIHRLYDGDLSLEEQAALEKELAQAPALGAKLEGLREIGVVVRAARTDEAPIDSEALWKGIEAQIASEAEKAAKPRPALRAIEGGRSTSKDDAAPAATAPAPAAPVEDLQTRRRRTIGIALGVLAIAAAALFVWLGQGEPDRIAETTPPASEVAPGPEDEAPPEEAVATAIDYTEVLAVDFGTNAGTIFAVEGEEGQRYAVVWLDDIEKDEIDGTMGDPTLDDGAGIETPN